MQYVFALPQQNGAEFSNRVEMANWFPAAHTLRIKKEVEIGYELPKLKGWTFFAVLTGFYKDDKSQKNVYAYPPGVDPMKEWIANEGVGVCEWCQLAAHRNETFVLNKGMKYKYVGRSCLNDFFKEDTTEFTSACLQLAELARLCEQAQDPDWLRPSIAIKCDLALFLAWVASVIEKHGWVAKASFNARTQGREPTANAVVKLLTPHDYGRYPELATVNTIKKQDYEPKQRHWDEARDTVRWALDLPEHRLAATSYSHNVNALARWGWADKQVAGLAASMIHARRFGFKPRTKAEK